MTARSDGLDALVITYPIFFADDVESTAIGDAKAADMPAEEAEYVVPTVAPSTVT